jgi:membrane protein DedA with SNARE-associated domain
MNHVAGVVVGIAVGSFVSEDLALISAVALVQTGVLPLLVGFLAAAGGIFVGDLLLFYAGRYGLKRVLSKKSNQRFDAFGRSGWSRFAVFFARFIPGARFPTYVGAGLARMPGLEFAAITGIAVVLWTGLGFWIGKFVPGAWIEAHLSTIVAGLVVLFVVITIASKRLRSKISFLLQLYFYRVLRFRYFEFWPMWLFYPPVVLYGVGLAIRYRTIRAPIDANPGVKNGGVLGESKSGILSSLGDALPESLKYGVVSDAVTTLAWMQKVKLSFPIVLKPDVGQRGSGVLLVRGESQLKEYFETVSSEGVFIAQEFCAFPNEIGVNYVRYPEQTRGTIVGITRKKFPCIVGDGVHTLSELIFRDARARYIAGTYLKRFPDAQSRVLAQGERLPLVESGNHCQGAIFEDGAELWSAQLEARIDEIVRQVPGVYTGRFDLRFSEVQELKAGKGFKIIELNVGAGEATQIYDANKTLCEAYGILFQQLRDLFRIGITLNTQKVR